MLEPWQRVIPVATAEPHQRRVTTTNPVERWQWNDPIGTEPWQRVALGAATQPWQRRRMLGA